MKKIHQWRRPHNDHSRQNKHSLAFICLSDGDTELNLIACERVINRLQISLYRMLRLKYFNVDFIDNLSMSCQIVFRYCIGKNCKYLTVYIVNDKKCAIFHTHT